VSMLEMLLRHLATDGAVHDFLPNKLAAAAGTQ